MNSPYEQALAQKTAHRTIDRRPRVGSSSPWGVIQDCTELATGIIIVSTASHGGIWLSPERVADLPPELREYRSRYHEGSPTWWEEDCEIALVMLAFPDLADAKRDPSARLCVQSFYPRFIRNGVITIERRTP